MKTIGNPEVSFEVADEFSGKNLLALRMNIKGLLVGTLKSPTYLPSFIGSLEHILTDDVYFNSGISREDYTRFFLIQGHLTEHYRITLEETFDDYEKRVIKSDKHIFFYFNHHQDVFFDHDAMISHRFEVVEIESHKDALNKFKEYVKINR